MGGELLKALVDGAAENGGGLCGAAVHSELRLEGRFFNIYAEGAAVRDPLPLGLQWMIDFDKGAFRGGHALAARREAGMSTKVVGVKAATGLLEPGVPVLDDGAQVGQVVASCHSYVLDADVGLASLPVQIAYSGLEFVLREESGPAVSTISMPPIMPRSLTVRLDEL
jgi:aminomethyltransferase